MLSGIRDHIAGEK